MHTAASRADPRPGPSLGAAFRTALGEFYFNSWRLVPANLAWGAGLIALYFVTLASPLIGLVAAPLLALPTAGLWRLAALIARGEPASLGDAFEAWRAFARPALAIGVATVGAAAVFVTNAAVGITDGGPIGGALATLAAWGLVVMVLWLLAAWPLLVDPWRAELPVRRRLRLAALLALAHPLRLGVLAAVVAVILVASTIAFAALVMVSLAYVALASTVYVLPAADRLEARLDGIVRAARDAADESDAGEAR